jgi:hypothetical protein
LCLRASATVFEGGALGPMLRLERTIRTWTGSGTVELEDRTSNLGSEVEAAPLLYHVNLGPPLLDEGAELSLGDDRGRVLPRDDAAAAGLARWAMPGKAERSAAELVFEHEVAPDPAGWCAARLRNPAVGLEFEMAWERAGLPRFHQWLHPAAGIYVLGLEPANCSVLGRAADRAAGRLPLLEPGETRITRVRIACRPVESAETI